MLESIQTARPQLDALCRRFGVQRLELFGSAVDEREMTPDSDIDLLVDLGDLPPVEYAEAYFGLKEEREPLLSLPVDLVTVPSLRNPYFRRQMEQTKALLYAG